MRTYFFLVAISAVACFVLSRELARFAAERNWARRKGDGPDGAGVPRLGGLAMFAVSLMSLGLLLAWDNDVARRLTLKPLEGLGLIAALLLVFALGLYDDLHGARPWQKLAVQAVAGIVLFAAGYQVSLMTNPFGGQSYALGWLSLPVTLVWLIAISNAFNLIDGLDGLAAGVGFFSTLALFLLAVISQNGFVAAITAIMAGSLLGFLPNNFAPARIYLGDAGSMTVGLALAALAVHSSQKGPVIITLAIPMMVFGLPLLDAGVTTVRRFLSGHPIFHRDEEHLHHRLLKTGFTHRAAVVALYGVAGFFALSSLLLVNYQSSVAPLIALLCGMLAWVVVRRMDYAEFIELDSHLRIALGSQRVLLRNQIHIRKAEKEMAAATGIDEAWEIAGKVFATLGFESSVCHLALGPGTSSVTLQWMNPAGHALQRDASNLWTMTVPLSTEDRRLGHIELSRTIESGTILFRTGALIGLLCGPFAQVAHRAAERLAREASLRQTKSA